MIRASAAAVAVAAAPGLLTVVEEDFTLHAVEFDFLTDAGPQIDELGGGWLGNITAFQYQTDNSGVMCDSTSSNMTAVVQTDGREEVQVTLDVIIAQGGFTDRWQGMVVRSTGSSAANGLLVKWDENDPDPNLVLRDDNATNLKTWDMSALAATQPVAGDHVRLVVRCTGNDITLYSINVNGGGEDVIDDTYTLTGTPATNHGAASGADYYGIFSHERVASSVERFEYFKVEVL